jgi:hypothetical protein
MNPNIVAGRWPAQVEEEEEEEKESGGRVERSGGDRLRTAGRWLGGRDEDKVRRKEQGLHQVTLFPSTRPVVA